MGGQTQLAEPAEKDLYPKIRGVSTKRPCEGSPPSGEERWCLVLTRVYTGATSFRGNAITVVAKTFFLARQEAAIALQCEPGEITGEML